MKSQLILCAALIPLFLDAQITVTSGDMPVVDSIYKYSWANEATGVDPVLFGPNYVWDFSFLTPLNQDADTFVAVSSTPFAYQFYFNNVILYPDWKSDYALKGQEFQLGNLSVKDVYNYFKNDQTAYKQTGFGATISGIPSSVRYNPIDYIFRFPMHYGDSDSSFSSYGFNIPNIGYFGSSQNRVNEVDGWGTLILPHDTFQVLRVKSVLHRNDTIYIDSLSFGSNIPQPVRMEYKWLANGMGEPVMQVNASLVFSNILVNSVRYYDHAVVSVEENQADDPFVLLFPNPAADDFRIKIERYANPSEPTALYVLDIFGRVLKQATFTGSVFDMPLEGFDPGVYFVKIEHQGANIKLHTLIVNP